MRRVFFFFCLTLYANATMAQNIYSLGNELPYIHSLEKEAEHSNDDSLRAYRYLQLSLLHRRTNDQTKSVSYLERGMKLGEKNPFIIATSIYYNAIVTYAARDINQFERHLLKADSALSVFDNAEANKLRGILWNNYGIVQQMKGDEQRAMNAFTEKAAHYASKSGDAVVTAKTYKAVAIVFMNANQREKASAYLNKAIGKTENLPDHNPVSLAELVETYIIAGENYAYQDQTDSAKIALDKAKKLLEPYPDSNLYLIYYYTSAVNLSKTKQYSLALDDLNKGIAMAARSGAVYSLNRLKYAKFKALSSLKKHEEAAHLLKDLIESPMVFVTDKKIYYKDLFTTYTHIGKAEEAVQWATRYITVSDSLYEANFQSEIMELEQKFKDSENQKKVIALQAEKEKATLEARNDKLLIWLLAAISLFLSVSVFFAIVLYKNSHKLITQKELYFQQQIRDVEQKQQIQLTKALMQGEEMERKRLAVDLHDGLGGRLAGIKMNLSRIATSTHASENDLEKVIEQLDLSSNELRRIARNMMPESLLQLGLSSALKDMCDSLSSESTPVVFQAYAISDTLPRDFQIHIYRIVQELLANALRHANASQTLVQCSQNENIFLITVEDNGSGFDVDDKRNKTGIGLNSVRNRVEFLKGKLDISSAITQGTVINIEFEIVNG